MDKDFRYKHDSFVQEIEKKEAKELVSLWHYLGDKHFMYSKAYGLFERLADKNEVYTGETRLIGVAVYSPVTGISALKSWFGLDNSHSDIYELIRLVMHPEHNGKNGASFLLGRSLRLLKKDKVRGVVSLADSEHHTGYVYQATNFKYYGLTDYKTDFYRWDGKLNPRGETKNQRGVWLPRSRKHRYFYQIDTGLVPVLKEEAYPKEATNTVSCCGGTKKVFDKRFQEEFDCPRCI